eukprot:6754815-Pyramimonas_sp.AAC.1
MAPCRRRRRVRTCPSVGMTGCEGRIDGGKSERFELHRGRADIPIEELGLLGGCGIFLLRDWDWSVDAVYSVGGLQYRRDGREGSRHARAGNMHT